MSATPTTGSSSSAENGVVTGRYSFGAVLDTSGTVIERTIALPGGVILTRRTGGDVWSYPNLRGEIVATADSSGAKVGPTRHYSPYGESYQALVDNAPDDYDVAWTGRRFTEHAGLTDTIEMGARLYSPQLGRFLEVDPVEGGSANDYEYTAGDPVNRMDLDGRMTGPSGYSNQRCSWWNRNYCETVKAISRWAIDTSRRMFGSADNGYANATRHFLWSSMLTYVFGKTQAIIILGLHELGGPGSSCHQRDRVADRHNNYVGIIFGQWIDRRGGRVYYEHFTGALAKLLKYGYLDIGGGTSRC